MNQPIPFVNVRLDVEREVKLDSAADLVSVLTGLGLATAAQEQLWVVPLDWQNHVRMVAIVSVGSYGETHVALPTVISPVLLAAADRFIIAHNHPNGKPNPTPDDIDLTRRIQAAARVMDLDFDDHFILTPTGAWESMQRLGHL